MSEGTRYFCAGQKLPLYTADGMPNNDRIAEHLQVLEHTKGKGAAVEAAKAIKRAVDSGTVFYRIPCLHETTELHRAVPSDYGEYVVKCPQCGCESHGYKMVTPAEVPS